MNINGIRRPVLRYFGSKWRLAPHIINMMPPHKMYVELYGGSATVLLRKEPSKWEIYNDLEKSVVNFFQVLRDDYEDLIRMIMLSPWSRAESKWCRDHTVCSGRLEWARRFYVTSWQIIKPSGRTGSSSGFRIGRGNTKGLCGWPLEEDLLAAARRLRHVVIECKNALDVIRMQDSPHTLFYVDPPYPVVGKSYVVPISMQHFVDLAEALVDLDGMFILSGNDSKFFTDIYDYFGFKKYTFDEINMVSKRTTECLWCNFDVEVGR